MAVDYLNLSRAEDFKKPWQKGTYRLLEVLPGIISWTTLAAGFILSWSWPFAVAVFIIAFDFYWLCRVLYLALHQIASYRKMEQNIKTDWNEKLKSSKKEWRGIYHLAVLPFANENKEVIEATLDSLVNVDYPKEKIIVLLAVEDIPSAREILKKIKDKYHSKFFACWSAIHPKGISGELQGKGANVNWAFKKVKDEFFPRLDIPKENVVVSLFDIDTKPYRQYFSCLTWHYLNTPDRLRCSFQPIPVYNNNIWEAPLVSRIIATSSTFWEMMQQERPEQLVTFSSHSMPLSALLDVGYPYNVVSDDSRIFWRAYFYYGGKYKVVPMYYPVSMDAVIGKTTWRTMINQYKQQRRWSWGVENLPYVFFNFFMNPASTRIKLREKIFHILTMLEGFWSWATGSLMTFGLGWMPLLLGGSGFNATLLSYKLPQITSIIMTAAMVGMVVSAVISMLLLPPRPANYGRVRSASMLLQWLFLPVTLIFFGSLPALESQTRLMIGKPLGFWITEKEKRSEPLKRRIAESLNKYKKTE
jgi:cellulose synthase/poly-beta-1,6-N-acetylglucosamine synthase-like glycosyltransferase